MLSGNWPVAHRSRARWNLVVLWASLWFWMGARLIVPLLLRDNLYTASVVSVFSAVGYGFVFALFTLVRPSVLKSSVSFWAAVYYGMVFLATSISPLVSGDNFLRVVGLLAVSISISLSLIVGFRLMPPLSALVVAAQWYIPGVLLATLFLLVTNPAAFAFLEVGGRFGDAELLHPNSLGLVYGLGLLFLLFLPVYPWRLVQYGLTFLLGLALLATFSKTSIAAVVVAIAVAWLVLRGVRKLVFGFAAALGGTVLALLMGNYVLSQLQAYFDNPYLSSTLSGRTVLWHLILKLVTERPVLGFGFGVLKDLVGPYSSSLGWSVTIVQAHNAYFDVLFSSGYLGLIFFVLLILRYVYIVVVAIRSLRGDRPAAFLAAVTVFLLARSLTEGALNLGFDFWVLMTAALAAERLVWLSRFKRIPR